MNDYDAELEATLQELGLSVPEWSRRVSASEVVYLLDQCPFLEISDPQSHSTGRIKRLKSPSGWNILDLGNKLISSPGELRYGHPKIRSSTDESEGSEGGGAGVPKAGTLINQAVITAFQMVELGFGRNWSIINIVDGHPLMAWAAWVKSMELGVGIDGFVPSAKDFAKLKRLKAPRSEAGISPKFNI